MPMGWPTILNNTNTSVERRAGSLRLVARGQGSTRYSTSEMMMHLGYSFLPPLPSRSIWKSQTKIQWKWTFYTRRLGSYKHVVTDSVALPTLSTSLLFIACKSKVFNLWKIQDLTISKIASWENYYLDKILYEMSTIILQTFVPHFGEVLN